MTQSKPGTADRQPAGRVEPHHISQRDREVLRFAGEQYAVRVDQLAVHLGYSVRGAQNVYSKLHKRGLIDIIRRHKQEYSWAVPTVEGLRAAGLPFDAWMPRPAALTHVGAVTDVRLYVQSRARYAEWVCERVLAREKRSPEQHLADGLVLFEGWRIAIEVELTVKSKRRLLAIVGELICSHHAVLYYCAPQPLHVLRELAAEADWPSLGIRELPAPQKPR